MAELWKELHSRALTYASGNDISYLKDFAKRIPMFKGCRCQEDWVKILKANPPSFRSKEEYFAWSVLCHNLVNEKLGKATMTVEEAKKLYQKN